MDHYSYRVSYSMNLDRGCMCLKEKQGIVTQDLKNNCKGLAGAAAGWKQRPPSWEHNPQLLLTKAT